MKESIRLLMGVQVPIFLFAGVVAIPAIRQQSSLQEGEIDGEGV
jgi:hypothetical protein